MAAELILDNRALAVFVDDTGHEELVAGHPVYGLGGCAALGRDLESLISNPWREVRRIVAGSPDVPLHANKFSKLARGKEDMELVANFFRIPFARFGAILSNATNKDVDLTNVRIVKEVLELRISAVMQWTLCREVKIIFESSERADPLIEEAFQGLSLKRGLKEIPVECFFMPKSVHEPALEVADFVVHAMGRQARKNINERSEFLPDFKAVFQSVDRKLSSYMEIGAVHMAQNNAAPSATPSRPNQTDSAPKPPAT